MQANTVEVANQGINFPNFSVENRPHKADLFSIRDGRYVGHDGFVVPKDFDEFHERFPQYVRNWVSRHAGSTASNEDLEDWTQDLLIHLRHLPLTSKHREAGKEDIVQTFDPRKHFGANQARFQNYINLCLTNKFRTLRSKRMKDALSQPGNVSLDTGREWGDSFSVGDEYCHSHSEQLREAVNTSEKRNADRALAEGFTEFIRREHPNALPAVEAIAETGTHEEAAQEIGTTRADFRRVQLRLRELGRSFLSRKGRPERRKCVVRWGGGEAKASNGEGRRPLRQSKAAHWDRVDLYTEVWNQPLVNLSRKHGISDVRLGKVCRKLEIPHPGRGYWAKKAVGRVVSKEPLPEFEDAPLVRRLKMRSSRRSVQLGTTEGEKERLSGS